VIVMTKTGETLESVLDMSLMQLTLVCGELSKMADEEKRAAEAAKRQRH